MQGSFQGTPGPDGARYFYGRSPWANNSASPDPEILYQNVNSMYLAEGVWYQIRVHFDLSGAQGTFEMWVRAYGETNWTKVTEWIGGVTPDFTWPIPLEHRNGQRVFSMPTTVDDVDSTTYMDDFIMATSVDDLVDNTSRFSPSLNLRRVSFPINTEELN